MKLKRSYTFVAGAETEKLVNESGPRSSVPSIAYLLGNLTLIMLLWLPVCFAIWFWLVWWWFFKVILVIVAYMIIAYTDHAFLTGYVGKLVETLVSRHRAVSTSKHTHEHEE